MSDLKRLADEVEELGRQIDAEVNLTNLFHVDFERNIVIHGVDTFYIAEGKMEEYLLLKKEKFELLLKAARGEIKLSELIKLQNILTLQLTSLHRSEDE